MEMVSISLTLLILLVNSLLFANGLSDNNPQLKFGFIDLKSNSSDFEINWKHIGDNAFFSLNRSNNTFRVLCSAPYPIMWSFDGFISPERTAGILPYKRKRINASESIFIGRLVLVFTENDNSSSSIKIYCQSISDLKSNASFSVFVPGISPLINSGQTITLKDQNVIPCATTNPMEKVYLLKINNNQTENVTHHAEYVASKGFILAQPIEGKFMCTTSPQDSVYVNSLLSATTNTNFSDSDIAFPQKTGLFAFTNQAIDVFCESPTEDVSISGLPLSVNSTYSSLKYTYLIREKQKKKLQFTYQYPTIGNLSCKKRNYQKHITQIRNWTYYFVDRPYLKIDNYEQEVQCHTNDKFRSIATVRCADPSECNFKKHCFKNPTTCNYKEQVHFSSNDPNRCKVWNGAVSDSTKNQVSLTDCALVPISHINGIVECRVAEKGLATQFEFFSSLSFLKYSHWKDAEKNDLIKMDEINDIVYTNTTVTFFCSASAYLFADSVYFSMELENGTSLFLDENIYENPEFHPRKIDELNVLGILTIYPPIDAVGVTCYAPWWNETGYLNTSRVFKTKHLLKPTIKQQEPDKTFIVGEVTSQLICPATGEPTVVYEWLYNDMRLNVTDTIRMSISSDGEGILQVTDVDASKAGVYKCKASNYLDTAEFEFVVHVEEPVASVSKLPLGLGLGFSLLFLFIMIPALVFLFHRYRDVQARLRELSDQEIQEFLEGRPDVNSKFGKPTAQTLDMHPYDRSYEIPLDDVTMGSHMLGSGEFSYVVTGYVRSINKAVAVKVAKTTADVTNFKAMLSELKICIYIGQHENVVELVGACTENIQNRNLHILLELNENGSMEKYLRERRSKFVDLLDQFQDISLSLALQNIKTDDSDAITTIHLVIWAKQIAQGMEYLSFKSVVHADLALRNVLLSKYRIAKISDFGLSRQLYESTNYVKKTKIQLPFRWMALESLKTLTFSVQSDVWSFGITVWEMFTLGDIPFPGEKWNAEFISRLESGMRMGRPKHCTQQIFFKIMTCWEQNPEIRPTFSNLRGFFADIIKNVDAAILVYNEKSVVSPFADETKLKRDSISSYRRSSSVTTVDVAMELQIPSAMPRKHFENPNYSNMENYENTNNYSNM